MSSLTMIEKMKSEKNTKTERDIKTEKWKEELKAERDAKTEKEEIDKISLENQQLDSSKIKIPDHGTHLLTKNSKEIDKEKLGA